MNNKDMPAMPLRGATGAVYNKDDPWLVRAGSSGCIGLTKREYIAIAAMQGLLARHGDDDYGRDKIAEYAVDHADALLKALEES